MRLERLFHRRRKIESIPVESAQTVEDMLLNFYGPTEVEAKKQSTQAPVTETVEAFVSRARVGGEFVASISASLSSLMVGGQSFLSVFSHGGALCAHCVTSVASGVGQVGGLSPLGGIGGVLPSVGGHWHADGSYHASPHHHHEHHSHQSHTTPSLRGQAKRSLAPSQTPHLWRPFPESTLSLTEFFSFTQATIGIADCLRVA